MSDGADDLDAFFDEVSAVEEAVAKEEDDDGGEEIIDSSKETTRKDELGPAPAKKQKTAASAPFSRPRGIVIAAASQKVRSANEASAQDAARNLEVYTGNGQMNSIAPDARHPPPPPPPPPLPSHPITAGPTLPNEGHAAADALHRNNSPTVSHKPHVRTAAGKTWVDKNLADWPDNDFRLFVGNLGNEVSDEQLFTHFSKYASIQQAKIIRDTKTGNSKGYGFISLMNALECAKALREMDQSWLSTRPIKVKRSQWKDRELNTVRKKEKQHKKKMKRSNY